MKLNKLIGIKMKADPPTIPDAITIYVIKLNLVNAMFEILKPQIWQCIFLVPDT